MRRFGSALSCFSILGYTLIASLASRNIREAVSVNASAALLVNLLAGLAVLSSFVAWGLALYHWGTTADYPTRRTWGIGLILGTFVGAWIYWLWPWSGRTDDRSSRS